VSLSNDTVPPIGVNGDCMTCPTCGHELQIGDFPFCKGSTVDHANDGGGGPARDDIPGGILIEHAICHPDGTPRRFDSKSAIREEARRRGWTISGETPKDPGPTWF
jgi:hypothetical protein